MADPSDPTELAAQVRAEIEAMATPFVAATGPGFHVHQADGARMLRQFFEVTDDGFISARDAADSLTDELEKRFSIVAGKPSDAVVWREFPEIVLMGKRYKRWAYYARLAFVRLNPGDTIDAQPVRV